MAVFPTFTYKASLESDETLRDDLAVDRASNGAVRVRAFYSAPRRSFVLRLGVLTAAEKATLETFYNTNRTATFSFVWDADGVSYTCVFAQAPKFKRLVGARWSAEVNLEQV